MFLGSENPRNQSSFVYLGTCCMYPSTLKIFNQFPNLPTRASMNTCFSVYNTVLRAVRESPLPVGESPREGVVPKPSIDFEALGASHGCRDFRVHSSSNMKGVYKHRYLVELSTSTPLPEPIPSPVTRVGLQDPCSLGCRRLIGRRWQPNQILQVETCLHGNIFPSSQLEIS